MNVLRMTLSVLITVVMLGHLSNFPPDNTSAQWGITAAFADGLDDTSPPEVLDIDDPFSRDLKRAADDATGGINFDADGLGIQDEEATGLDLLGAESRAAIIASKFRILGVAVARRPDSNHIYINPREELVSGSKPLMNYLRIGSHASIDDARQQAINLKSSFGEFLDASFVIRTSPNDTSSDLDIGPFETIIHAERYCDMMLVISYGIVGDCYVVQEFPGLESRTSFSSSAMVRYSANAVDEVISETSVFDLPAAANQMLTIKEGTVLGRGSTIATKIVPSGIMVVDEIGTVIKLPLNYVPEDDFVEAEKQNLVIPTIPIEQEASPVPGAEPEKPQTAADILLNTDEN